MKNKLLVLGAMVCLLAILAAGTLAYFTTTAVTHNVITTGEIDISIVETVPEGTPIRDKDGNITGYQILDIMPDKTVTKNVTIHNDAQEPAWIRVKLNHTIVDKNKEPLSTQEDGVDMVQYRGTGDKWIQSGGWYYYNEPVAGGADTEPVLKEVYFAAEMGNAYQECTVTLSVEAEAVQSKNNPIPAGGKVTDIPGWPTA